MNGRLALAAAFVLVARAPAVAQSPPGSAPSNYAYPATSGAGEQPAITAGLKKQILALQSGKIDRADYNARMNAALTPQLLAQASGELKAYGPPKSLSLFSQFTKDDDRAYLYRVETAKGTLHFTYVLDASGKISGLYFKPAPPSGAW
jgi:hypothetical protein